MGILLLLVLATALADKWEMTTGQKVMPTENVTHFLHAKQPTTERTIAHLYAERRAMPTYTIGEVPSFHPHPSKSKCLHPSERLNRYEVRSVVPFLFSRCPAHSRHRVIDYYIYRLEHILI